MNAVANETDTYAGGTALVLLGDQFTAPLGATPLAVNLPFAGNPFTPVVGGGPVPLYEAGSLLGGAPSPTVQVMSASRTVNKDGTITVEVVAQTQDGSAFISESTPLFVETATGIQEANRFVLDFGNGYENPLFPVDGVEGCGGSAGTIQVIQGVDYFFTRLDGSENLEFGDAPVQIREDGSMTFAWGFQIDDARNFNRCGFRVTFTPTPEPGSDCPTDLDGSGGVGGEDLAILLGGWGSDGDADFNDDFVIDGSDLAILLGAWGTDGCGGDVGDTSDPSGACCTGVHTCTTTTESNCASQAGVFYQGQVCYQTFICP
ncbi:MAG: hypothetical protein VX641_02840 [Planctomycetota bacterium]|nr:hypothetical protein [Planctomycetota bacterium]